MVELATGRGTSIVTCVVYALVPVFIMLVAVNMVVEYEISALRFERYLCEGTIWALWLR